MRTRTFACALVGSVLSACGGRTSGSNAGTSGDAGTKFDASATLDASVIDAQADSGPFQGSLPVGPLPTVPVTCDSESLPDAGATSPPDSGARCDPTPRLLVRSSTFPVPSYKGSVFEGVWSLTPTPVGLYYAIAIAENNGEAADAYIAGALLRVPLVGGQPTAVGCGYLFDTPVDLGSTLVMGANGLVAPSSGRGTILIVPLAGGPARVLFTLPDNDGLPGPVASDGQFVYFPDQRGILAVPLDPQAGAAPIRVTTTFPVNSVGAFGQRLVFLQSQVRCRGVPLPPIP